MGSLPNYFGYTVTPDGDVYSPSGRKLKPQMIDKRGYFCVWPNGKKIRLHRLVAQVHIPNPSGLPEVNHINGVKSDNRACNLEWSSRSANMAHAMKNGLRRFARGSKNGNCKLSDQDVADIRSAYVGGRRSVPCSGSASTIAKRYGVDTSLVYLIVKTDYRSCL